MDTTSSQTIGPYLHIGMDWAVDPQFAGPGVKGERVTVTGRIVDGDGDAVGDAMLEIWQANAQGRYAHPEDTREPAPVEGFMGWGRVTTDEAGRFRFSTIKPGRVASAQGMQAPHLNVTVFMRGMLKQLITRIYFGGDGANGEDPVLARVPQDRRDTLVAHRHDGVFEWNIVLQGAGETVFFEL